MRPFTFPKPWSLFLARRELVRAAFLLTLFGGLLAHIPQAVASGSWFGHNHHSKWGHGHHHSVASAAEAREHAETAVRWALKSVDATAQQQDSAAAVVRQFADDVFPLFENHRQTHEQVLALLSSPTIDRARLQELREQVLALWSEGSTKLVDGIIDLAEVLTPEQRRELLEAHRG